MSTEQNEQVVVNQPDPGPRPRRDVANPRPERTQAPPDSDPGVIVGAHIEQNPGALDVARGAMSALHETENRIHDLAREVDDKRGLAEKARPAADAALRRADQAITDLRAKQHELVRKMIETTQPHPSHPIGAEIRAFVREQKDPVSFVMGRIRAGDVRTVSAVLNGEDFLSGLSLDQRDVVMRHARTAFAPAEQGLFEDIDRAVGRIENSVKSFREGFYPRIERWAAESDEQKLSKAFAE